MMSIRWQIPLFALWALLYACLPVGRAAAPASTIPSDSNYREHPEWNQGCEAALKAMQGKRCDVIFIGDSITAMW